MNLEPTPKMLALNAPADFFTQTARNERLAKILYAIRFEEAVLDLIDDQLVSQPESPEIDAAYEIYQELTTGLNEAAGFILDLGELDILEDTDGQQGLTGPKLSDPGVLELLPFDGGEA